MRHLSDEICKEYGLSVLEEKGYNDKNINIDDLEKEYDAIY